MTWKLCWLVLHALYLCPNQMFPRSYPWQWNRRNQGAWMCSNGRWLQKMNWNLFRSLHCMSMRVMFSSFFFPYWTFLRKWNTLDMVSKNKVSDALMSVLSFPCNSGCVFLRAYLLCARNQTGPWTNVHCFQVIRTLGKKGTFPPVSCLWTLNDTEKLVLTKRGIRKTCQV